MDQECFFKIPLLNPFLKSHEKQIEKADLRMKLEAVQKVILRVNRISKNSYNL